jgi:mono/diheme cytochrome c family protein
MQTQPRRLSFFICAAVAAMLCLVGVSARAQAPVGGSADAKKMKNPVAWTPASIAAGAASYKKYCAFCHGEGAKGDGKLAPKGTTPADLTDAKWDHGSTDGELFAVIMSGAGAKLEMKGFKGRVPDQEAWNIINYVRSLGPAAAKR